MDEVFKTLAEAKATAPDSEVANSMDAMKERIEGAKKKDAEKTPEA